MSFSIILYLAFWDRVFQWAQSPDLAIYAGEQDLGIFFFFFFWQPHYNLQIHVPLYLTTCIGNKYCGKHLTDWATFSVPTFTILTVKCYILVFIISINSLKSVNIGLWYITGCEVYYILIQAIGGMEKDNYFYSFVW